VIESIPDCRFRECLDIGAFCCRHPKVHVRRGFVATNVCGACGFEESWASVQQTCTNRTERILAVPAESLRRDPSGWHKSIYARLIAQASDAILMLLASGPC